MNFSENKFTDPVDALIYQKGLRIYSVIPIKKLNLLIVVLNNSVIIKLNLNEFPLLAKANQEQLNNYELKRGGISIRWDELDEDLSLHGFISNSLMKSFINKFEKQSTEEIEIF